MNPWCIDQHGKTGLTASCLSATLSMAEVDKEVSKYVARHFPGESMVLLAGSSVHADKAFIHKVSSILVSRSLACYRIVMLFLIILGFTSTRFDAALSNPRRLFYQGSG